MKKKKSLLQGPLLYLLLLAVILGVVWMLGSGSPIPSGMGMTPAPKVMLSPRKLIFFPSSFTVFLLYLKILQTVDGDYLSLKLRRQMPVRS